MYAGFLKPGRHQIIIYDQLSDTFWAKNIVIDLRECDPKPNPEFTPAQSKVQVYGDIYDLDNSVFRNFFRYDPQNVVKCVSNDLRFWIGDSIVTRPEAYSNLLAVI